jgi:hypothetical protein
VRLKSLIVASVLVAAIVAILAAIKSDDGKWLLKAGEYKKQVLAQPTSPRGDLKHIEWGGWGMAGQETTVFLVYDPADNLAAVGADKPGKFEGIPCEVQSLRPLERNWYLATFYTNTDWSNCSP